MKPSLEIWSGVIRDKNTLRSLLPLEYQHLEKKKNKKNEKQQQIGE